MIWNSVFLMTIIDILIVGVAGYAAIMVPKQLGTEPAEGMLKSRILAVMGLGLFAFFYLADLIAMHVLPWFMPQLEARDIMVGLHTEYKWGVVLVVVVCISMSLVISARSMTRLIENMKAADARLRDEIAYHGMTEKELHEGDRRLQTIIDTVPVGISYFDCEQRFEFANQNYETLLGYSPGDLKGRSLTEAIGEEAYEIAGEYARRALNGERVSFENTLPDRGHGHISIFVTYVPDIGPEGAVRGFYALVQNVTELKIAELKDPELRVREQAKSRIAEARSNAMVPLLLVLLEDENRSWRLNAIRTLKKLALQDSVEPLVKALDDSDFEVRSEALEALKAIRATLEEKREWKALLEQIKKSPTEEGS